MGGLDKVALLSNGNQVFLVYDYEHIFKNIGSNWITESSKPLVFVKEGKEYPAC